VYSEEGHGTTVRIYLPRAREEEDLEANIDAGPAKGGSETILVVEDDEEVRATVVEMLAGGLLLLPIGVIATSPHPSEFSARSIFGWIYLVTFGSVVGYTAYVWLLANAPLGLVSTYAYVNPVVAIVLGVLFRGEELTVRLLIGAVVIVAAVALVVRQEPPVATEIEEAPS
jgi:drug/metabolite transporter (DMT)-like permease